MHFRELEVYQIAIRCWYGTWSWSWSWSWSVFPLLLMRVVSSRSRRSAC